MGSGSGASGWISCARRSDPMTRAEARADVLLVVLDCVRAKSLAPWGEDGLDPPFLRRFVERSTVFDRCLAPTPWSVPSHASIFTGLYPWHHGVHGKSNGPLRAPTAFEELGAAGYRTLSLSGNPFVSPKTGLTTGFDSAYWSSWANHYLRFLRRTRPTAGYSLADNGLNNAIHTENALTRSLLAGADIAQTVRPSWWRFANLAAYKLDPTRAVSPPTSSPWVEPCLEDWLSRVPRSEPVACFVNLMDAHEPYLLRKQETGSRTPVTKPSQLVDGHDRGKEDLAQDTERLRILELRYLDAIEILDSRLQNLIRIMGSYRSLDEALVIVTSDHGQGFGERGHVFHEYDAGDETLRVPLLVQFPAGVKARVRTRSWASLVDIAPTIREFARIDRARQSDGESLSALASRRRAEPVLAISDGRTEFGVSGSSGPRGATRLTGRAVVGCLEDLRLEIREPNWEPCIVDGNEVNGQRVNRVDQDRTSGHGLATSESRLLVQSAMEVVEALRSTVSVDQRLRSWGY